MPRIVLNEWLPNPRLEYSNEWVEIVNREQVAVDMGGWQIDDGVGGSQPYTIEEGTVIVPEGHLLVQLPRNLLNNSGDILQLLDREGRVVDQVHFSAGDVDRSFCRLDDEQARMCHPTPGEPNELMLAPSPITTEQVPAQFASMPPTTSPMTMQETAALPSSTPDLPPTVQLPDWPAFAGVTPYTHRISGRLYQGIIELTPSPFAADAAHQMPSIATPSSVDAPKPFTLDMPIGGGLVGCGLLMLGSTWLRQRRRRRHSSNRQSVCYNTHPDPLPSSIASQPEKEL